MPEWEAPAVVLAVRPFGEADALATVLAREHGAVRSLVRGGSGRRQSGTWQPGNLVAARWMARVAGQLGTIAGELVHPGAALVLDDPLALAVLSSACATAEGALADDEVHPRVFDGLLHLVAHIAQPGAVAHLVRWEAVLLSELGYGLDLSRCAVSGRTDGLAFVSPRTGRAVRADQAGAWTDRLLTLPPFLLDDEPGTPAQWADGLRLTGHFLQRDAFGHLHRAVPAARDRLEAMLDQQRAGPPTPA